MLKTEEREFLGRMERLTEEMDDEQKAQLCAYAEGMAAALGLRTA